MTTGLSGAIKCCLHRRPRRRRHRPTAAADDLIDLDEVSRSEQVAGDDGPALGHFKTPDFKVPGFTASASPRSGPFKAPDLKALDSSAFMAVQGARLQGVQDPKSRMSPGCPRTGKRGKYASRSRPLFSYAPSLAASTLSPFSLVALFFLSCTQFYTGWYR